MNLAFAPLNQDIRKKTNNKIKFLKVNPDDIIHTGQNE